MQKIRPILFSTPMVQAILEGRKTMTRRICKHKLDDRGARLTDQLEDWHGNKIKQPIEVGDIVWVRETFAEFSGIEPQVSYVYKADKLFDTPAKEHLCDNKWKPSLFMPKQACRIWLEVTNVRLERLQDISEEDAIAEGVERVPLEPFVLRYRDYTGLEDYWDNAKSSFHTLWIAINGATSWQENPWVWVYEFKQVEMPINFLN